MLRVRYKNIEMKFLKLVLLCLCYYLIRYLSIAPVYAARNPSPPYYIVDAYQETGRVYKIMDGKPSVFFRRRLGSISNIAICQEHLFFCSLNDKRIYHKSTGRQQERIIFEHRAYIRDIAIDPNRNLYFSEAMEEKGEVKIYKLTPCIDDIDKLGPEGHFSILPVSRKRPIRVRLRTVGKLLGGDFEFDADGNIYLSSGKQPPGFIYKVPRQRDGQYGTAQDKYTDVKGAIKGIAIHPKNSNLIYYANWDNTVFRLNIGDSRRSIAFSGSLFKSRNQHLSDIAFKHESKEE